MPDTVEEAEKFGMGQSFFLVPYIARQKQNKKECEQGRDSPICMNYS
jgi:hypothetical protein